MASAGKCASVVLISPQSDEEASSADSDLDALLADDVEDVREEGGDVYDQTIREHARTRNHKSETIQSAIPGMMQCNEVVIK